MTFSIVALDPQTGELGACVCSRMLAVGSIVIHAKAGIGAVASQAIPVRGGVQVVNSRLIVAPDVRCKKAILSDDPRCQERQIILVDVRGRAAAQSGSDCPPTCKQYIGANFACAGNLLVSPNVLESVSQTFEAQTTADPSSPLGLRLVNAMIEGFKEGGDARHATSAALLVVRKNGGVMGDNDRYIDLRVDENSSPMAELKRLLALRMSHISAQRCLSYVLEAEALVLANPPKSTNFSGSLEDMLGVAGSLEFEHVAYLRKAMKWAERAIDNYPSLDVAWVAKGTVCAALGEDGNAVDAALKVIQLNPWWRSAFKERLPVIPPLLLDCVMRSELFNHFLEGSLPPLSL